MPGGQMPKGFDPSQMECQMQEGFDPGKIQQSGNGDTIFAVDGMNNSFSMISAVTE